ncbi:anaphase-promoting complex subunit 11 RING-H2 finger-domain-containing protein [Phialemonium atrogriseum]|uniref:Anaphase-promoting complex subunit 11 n=1 Tax=Phialemonium atrogriseum TaxID=1093897 RepID=A0AAJ0BPT5_9PEZI|nr:anaphase-promoting complex subunit 11 RING-H2 finger-domain-containing protein [Phialemonium atrogriseum]KAK1762076.1 anaphase-promoting complex subunit 11 RING-H2 finger-domain-containing protein [Phialemonium atrogriseum]
MFIFCPLSSVLASNKPSLLNCRSDGAAMKVKIKKWNAVATWRWDLPEDDVCGICQVHFDGTCPTCKYPGDDCSLLSGKCGHNFHMHCILEWIKQESSKGQCPMCRQRFEWTQQQPEQTPLDAEDGD